MEAKCSAYRSLLRTQETKFFSKVIAGGKLRASCCGVVLYEPLLNGQARMFHARTRGRLPNSRVFDVKTATTGRALCNDFYEFARTCRVFAPIYPTTGTSTPNPNDPAEGTSETTHVRAAFCLWTSVPYSPICDGWPL